MTCVTQSAGPGRMACSEQQQEHGLTQRDATRARAPTRFGAPAHRNRHHGGVMGRGRLARTSAARAKATAGRVLILRADGCVSSTGPHARAQLDGNRRMHVGRHTRAHLQRSALSTRFKLPRVLIVARTGPGDPRGAKRGADRRSTSTLSFPFPFRFAVRLRLRVPQAAC